MEIERYDVPAIDRETLELCNEVILVTNEIIEHDTGLIGDKILAKALSIRVRNSAACITRLSNLGFIHESQIILRSIAEATILFHAAINNLGFKNVYVLEESQRVLGLLKKQRLLIDPNDAVKIHDIDNQIAQAKTRYATVRTSTYDLGDLALKNNCKNIYVYFYTLGHGYVHCLPNTISNYFTKTSETSIQFNHTPNLDERDMVISAGLQCYSKMGLAWAKSLKVDALISKAEELQKKLKTRFTENILNDG